MLELILERVLSILFCMGTDWATGWDYLGWYSVYLLLFCAGYKFFVLED